MTLTREDLIQVRKLLRTEVLLERYPEPVHPPPADQVSEQVLLSAILNSEHKPSEFPKLSHEHFSEPLKRCVWKMAQVLVTAGHEPKLEPILVGLREQGFSGPVAQDLMNIRDKSPSVSKWELDEAANRVIELWHRRRLIEALGRLRTELECGAITHDDACIRLSRYIEEFGS